MTDAAHPQETERSSLGVVRYRCPDCGAEQPEPGRCGRCPGITARWDEGPCFICGAYVPSRDGWHREDYDGVSRHWCPDHQPVWSRMPCPKCSPGMTDLMVTPESIDAFLAENPPDVGE